MRQVLICVMLAVLLTLMALENASAGFGGCMHFPNGCWYDSQGRAHTHPKGFNSKGTYTNPYKQK